MKKKVLIAFSVLLVLGIAAAALIPSPVPVSVTAVQKGYFAEYVEDEGFTRVRYTHVVAAPISGYLHRVDLEPGDSVRPGDTLFRLEPLPAPTLDPRAMEQAREQLEATRARVEAARSDHEKRQHERDHARTELERHKLLYDRDVVSRQTLDRIRNDHDRSVAAERAARAVAEAAHHEMENARAVLAVASGTRPGGDEVMTIKSFVDGLVLRRERHHEGVVQAGEVFLEIGSLDDLEVQVDFLSSEAIRLRSGMRVILQHWGGSRNLEGRVRRVEPAGYKRVSALGVDEQRVPVFVELTSARDEWEYLGEGYRVEAQCIIWEDDEVIQIPVSALFRREGTWSVFVVENSRARQRNVGTGRRSGLMTQITHGLEPGEKVITHPGDRIVDGTRVKGHEH